MKVSGRVAVIAPAIKGSVEGTGQIVRPKFSSI